MLGTLKAERPLLGLPGLQASTQRDRPPPMTRGSQARTAEPGPQSLPLVPLAGVSCFADS